MSDHSVVLAVFLCSMFAACGEPEPGGSTAGQGSSSGETSTGAATTQPTGGPTTGETHTSGSSPGETTTGNSGDGSTGGGSTGGGTTTDVEVTTGGAETTGGTGTTGAVDCGDGSLGPGDHTIEVEHDGLTRTALVHVPASIDPGLPTPLVLNFHGFTSNAAQQSLFSAMNPTADAEGFIVAYPEGIDNSWNSGTCCGNAMTQQVDDVGFVRKVVDALATRLCIDDRRIYATGMSNGGFMSHRLACEAADLVAAVAPVSAVNVTEPCEPGRPVPVMMFNGTADPLVPYNGGGNHAKSAPETYDDWAERDACTDQPVPGKVSGLASCESRTPCDAGVSVTLCTFQGMGHCWPGQVFCPLGLPSTDLSANAEMWAFFSKYTLP